ncbi:MAG: cell envelope integrity EipB family protein [Mesorhizobium sp.]
MRLAQFAAGSVSLLMLLVSQGTAAPGAPNLLAHRAVYDLDLGDATEKSGVVGVAGRIVYQFTGSSCEGYQTNYRFVSRMTLQESQRTNDYQITTFEDGQGKDFNFVTKFFVDDQLDKETKGAATVGGAGMDVQLQKPDIAEVDLPKSNFPTQHTIELIEKAKAGENFYETTIYDGSDDGDKVMTTTVIIGKETKSKDTDPEYAALKSMQGDSYWPVSIAYFDMNKEDGEEVPDYAISFKLYANGLTRDLVMSYGQFSIKAKLVGLEMLDQKQACRPN